MSARESIENLWDRATPVAPLLDAYRAEVLREAWSTLSNAASKAARREPVAAWRVVHQIFDLIWPEDPKPTPPTA